MMIKKQNAIELLESASNDSVDSINLDDISNELVVFHISPNVSKGHPNEAISWDSIMTKEKTTKDDTVKITTHVRQSPRAKKLIGK